MSTQKTSLSEADLRQFTGSLVKYRHPLNRLVEYTEGVRHVANSGHAYWLIDAIASWINSDVFHEAATKDDRITDMHFWTLTVESDNTAVLFAKPDSPEEAFIVQSIPYTDFPLTKIDIWAAFDGRRWTLYLPSEH